jgi:hypothetical protein
MSKGVLYKYNGSGESKSQVTKFNGVGQSAGRIRHSNGIDWYDNYPMEEYHTANFSCTWTQSYFGSGGALYNGTFWLDDLVVGDDENFRALIGFNQNELQTFIGSGKVTACKLLINLKETSLNGNPDVYFGKYSYNSEPGTYTGQGDWGDQKHYQFPNQKVGGYWIDLNPTQATLADQRTAISCICMKAASANVEDMARFNGKVLGGYNSQLQLTVLK